MKASPYLIFNGNCKEAIKLYEKAFNTKATMISKYKDAPAPETNKMPKELGELVMHGVLPIGETTLYLCDTTPEAKTTFSTGSFACIELDSAKEVKAAFEVLKENAKILCEPQKTFWNNCYTELEDKFGLKWIILIECTCTEACASGYNPNCTCKACNCKDKK